MYIPCRYLHSQHIPSLVAGCVRFIGKLLFMLSLDEHPAVRVCGRYRLLLSPAAFCALLIILILYGALSQSLSLCVYLLPQLLRVYPRCLRHSLFLKFLLVGAGLDVGAVNKDDTGVYHAVIQRFVKYMFKYLVAQFLREPFAESIAHRCKMGYLIQQSIAQKPAVGQGVLYPLVGLPQRRDTIQVLDKDHLDEHHRVCARHAVVMAIVRLQPLIQPVVVHDFLNLPQQMVLRYQGIQVRYDWFSP